MGESIAMRVIQQYKTHFIVDPYLYATGQLVLNLPSFTTNDLQSLCYQAQTTFTSSQIILHLSSQIVIVGDLHGQILDLFRIIREFGMPDNTSYLFLGDIVDRGEFSVETATIIFALRVMYPDNVHIIRGNHEFAQLCSRCGFLEEVLEFYGSPTVFNAFVDAFAFMPLVALVDDDIVCVHGG
ncbi:hypothetical protein TRFO_09562 [Tritrichomonas foetus]|uniref:Serine/threonine-protein phosphatase n=1 Tax=Tritrichomonas foetus TaxID=1144522 RepID=A0A1J4JG41_9EUKA|nr:hypothetical protein TRFO_09562 [Tritrichomonas foetus]|eukprot:OHS97279.1 hypothetical protein TRFO_09562 [Tritrichomonas foetus]